MATTRVDEDPGRFGVVEVTGGDGDLGDGRVTGFAYKPDRPSGHLVTMEILAYRPVLLHDAVVRSGARVERAIVDAGVEAGPGATLRSADPNNPIAVLGATDGGDDEILSDGEV